MQKTLSIIAIAVLSIFIGLKAKAITIVQDQELRLSASSPSQTINVSVSDIPDNLRKSNRIIDGNVRVRFRFNNKRDRRRFTLNPKNGRLTISVVNGIIQPASITVTLDDPSEFTENQEFPFKIRANRKVRRRTGIESNFESNAKLLVTGTVVTGQVLVPPGDISRFSSTSSSLIGPQKAVAAIPAPNQVVEAMEINPAAPGSAPTLLATATADGQGKFTMTYSDSTADIGRNIFVQVTGNNSSAPNNLLRAPVLKDNGLILDTSSEFLSRELYDVRAGSLFLFSDDEVEEIDNVIRSYKLPGENTLSQTYTGISNTIEPTTDLIFDNVASTANEIIIPARLYKSIKFTFGYTVDVVDALINRFSLTTATRLEEQDVNFSQTEQSGIFDITGNTTRNFSAGGFRQIGTNIPPLLLGGTDITDEIALDMTTGVRSESQCIDIFMPAIETNTVTINSLEDPKQGRFAETPDNTIIVGKIDPSRIMSTDNGSGLLTSDAFVTSFQFYGNQANVEDRLTNIEGEFGLISFDTAINIDNNIAMASTAAACSLNNGSLTCSGDKAIMDGEPTLGGLRVSTILNSGTAAANLSLNGDRTNILETSDTRDFLIDSGYNGFAGDEGQTIITGGGFANSSINRSGFNILVESSEDSFDQFAEGGTKSYKLEGNIWFHNGNPQTFALQKIRALGTLTKINNIPRFAKSGIFLSDTSVNATLNSSDSNYVSFDVERAQADESSIITVGDNGKASMTFTISSENYDCYFSNDLDHFFCRVTSSNGYAAIINSKAPLNIDMRKIGFIVGTAI